MSSRQTSRALGAAMVLLLEIAPCADSFAQSAQTAASPYRDEWKPIPKTLSELLDADYDIVSILAPSPQTRAYFLRKPGSFVKCTEQAALREPPPLPTNLPPAPGAPQPEHPERKIAAPPKATSASAIECTELSRTSARRTP